MINATKVFIYFLIIILLIGAVSKTIIDMPLLPNDKSVNVLLVYLIVVSLVTILGVGIVNPLYHTAALANATVTLSADTTNGCLKIQVTGIASHNIRWAGNISTAEIEYT